ncbi:response regulator [Thiohalorhabdus sp. Cl-TMA]|uniref:Response regulator n=1 Tax=Thiohalorhabdus methylotrophus TaxID=3242694 RepID=A0ABV4U0U6_9GAMM
MKPLSILLAEDSPADARLIGEALEENRFFVALHHVIDGVEALRFLRREGLYADRELPDLILLDLNMPRKDGREVLAEVEQDPRLRRLPVVVLTTSGVEEDLVRSTMDHANAFLTKPVNCDEFMALIRRLGDFWLTAVKLPPHD